MSRNVPQAVPASRPASRTGTSAGWYPKLLSRSNKFRRSNVVRSIWIAHLISCPLSRHPPFIAAAANNRCKCSVAEFVSELICLVMFILHSACIALYTYSLDYQYLSYVHQRIAVFFGHLPHAKHIWKTL